MLEKIIQKSIIVGAMLSGLYGCSSEDVTVSGSSEVYADVKIDNGNVYSDSTNSSNEIANDSFNDNSTSDSVHLDTATKDFFQKDLNTEIIIAKDTSIDMYEVKNENHCPVFLPIENKSINAGENISFLVAASDQDNNNLKFTTEKIPFGANITPQNNTMTFSWTPECDQSGQYSPTFKVTDGYCDVTQTVSLTVNSVPNKMYYEDNDKDGFGSNITKENCVQLPGFVTVTADCNDKNSKINPLAKELCDYVDNNCDNVVDETYDIGKPCYADALGECKTQGVYACKSNLESMCNAIPKSPLLKEECNNLDDNCNGQTDEDLTKSCMNQCGKGLEYCVNGAWQNCNAPTPIDEICDNLDNDCNGITDDLFPIQQPCGVTEVGECTLGMETKYCIEGNYIIGSKCNAVLPTQELCDDKDNDCNGKTDEGLEQFTFYKDNDGDEFGISAITTLACKQPKGYASKNNDCDDTNKAINPFAAEKCDGVDDNCNGITDDGVIKNLYKDNDKDKFGDANDSKLSCTEIASYVSNKSDCNDKDPQINPNAKELCDAIDNDCNGQTDDGLPLFKWYYDKDGDGFGGLENIALCSNPKNGKPATLPKDSTPVISLQDDCDDTQTDQTKIKGKVVWKSKEQCDETSLLSVDDVGRIWISTKDGQINALSTIDGTNVVKFGEGKDPAYYKGLLYTKNKNNQNVTTIAKVFEVQDIPKMLGFYAVTNCNNDPIAYSWFDMSIAFDGTMYLTTSLGDTDPLFTDWCGMLEAVGINQNNNLSKLFSAYINNGNNGSSIGPGEIIYVSRDGGVFEAYYPNGQLKATKNVSSNNPPIFGPNGEMYVTTSDGKLQKLDQNLNLKWGYASQGEKIPVVNSQGVMYTSKGILKESCGIFGCNPNVSLYDKSITDVTEPLISKDVLYLASKNALHAVNPKTGSLLWTINVDPDTKKFIMPTHLNIDQGGHLYFCNATDNKVYSVCANSPLNPNDPWPMQRHDPGNTRNFNVPIK